MHSTPTATRWGRVSRTMGSEASENERGKASSAGKAMAKYSLDGRLQRGVPLDDEKTKPSTISTSPHTLPSRLSRLRCVWPRGPMWLNRQESSRPVATPAVTMAMMMKISAQAMDWMMVWPYEAPR
eukprot:scaffold1236_cov116-Isochrysis_galbana.AAC.4